MSYRSRSWLSLLFVAVLSSCSSDDTSAPAEPVAAAPAPLRALVVHEGGPHLVLRAGLDPALTEGEVELVSSESPVVTRRAVGRGVTTAAEEAWVGQRVRLHGPRGAACEAVVSGVASIGRFHTDDMTRTEWYDEQDALQVSLDELRASAWEKAPELGSLDLVGTLEVVEGSCEGAVWAQPADDSSPATGEAEPADAALQRQALGAVQASEAYREAQEQYEEFWRDRAEDGDEAARARPARWEEYGAPSVEVRLLVQPGGERFVVTSLQTGEGCGDFAASVTQLWRLRGGELELTGADGMSSEELPTGVVDLDGDGSPELLLPEGYLRRGVGGFEAGSSTRLDANLGCQC